MTPEERLARVEAILELNAQQTGKNSKDIEALVDAQMRTTMTLNRVIESQASLQAAQKKTEETLQAFIHSLQKGGNGHQ